MLITSFLLQIVRSSSNKPADGTDSKPALNPPAVPSTVREEVRKGIASLPIHVQAAAVYMIVDQPLDFAKQFHDVYMAKKKKDDAARQAAKRSEVDDVSRSMIEEPY